MATTARPAPYVWVTSITGHLGSEKLCLYAPWLRAHFRYDAINDGHFNRATWTADHGAMVQARAAELRADGWAVRLEGENQFRLVGQTGTILGGKPDIVAIRGDEALVDDCKTGKQRHGDYFQVLLYLYALPKCFGDLKGKRLSGGVVYKTQRVPVQPEELNAVRREQIFGLLRSVGGDTPQAARPSAEECGRCDIGPADCPQRIVSLEAVAVAEEF